MKRARKSMRGFRREAKGMAGVAQRAGSALKSMAASALIAAPTAIAYGFGRAVMAGEEFNQSLRSSLAIMGKVSDAMRHDMTQAALEVARVTKFSASDAAKSYFYLASAGLDAKQSLGALPAVARFAQAGMFDMALATDLLTDAQTALGLSSKDATKNLRAMGKVSDVLVKANTVANASVQQFSEALTTKAAAAIRFVNKDIEEGVAVLAAFAQQGIKAAEAGTALNIVFRDLQTKALQNVNAFKRNRVAVFDSMGAMRNIADIVADLESLLGELSTAQKKMTLLQMGFSDKSVVFIQALLGMSTSIRRYEAALRQAGGTTTEVADKQLTAWAKAKAKLGAAWTSLGIAATPLVTALADMATNVAALLEGFLSLPSAIEQAKKSFGEFLGIPGYSSELKDRYQHILLSATGKGPFKEESKGLFPIADAMEQAEGSLKKFLGIGWEGQRKSIMPAVTTMKSLGDVFVEVRQKIEQASTSFKEFLRTPKFKGLMERYRSWVPPRKRALDWMKPRQSPEAVVDEFAAKWRQFAEQIKLEIRSPFEEWEIQLADLRKALSKGLIDWDEFYKAKDQAFREYWRKSGSDAALDKKMLDLWRRAEEKYAPKPDIYLPKIDTLDPSFSAREIDPRHIAIPGLTGTAMGGYRKEQKVKDADLLQAVQEIKKFLQTGGPGLLLGVT